MSKRLYKSGSKWALWRWTHTPSGYITRLHLIKTPLFAICLHWIHDPDPEPDQHDHPVSFLSIVIRGGYTEQRDNWLYYRNWFNWIPATYTVTHKIVTVEPNTLTLCFMGPKTREWGYHTPLGWTWYKHYNRHLVGEWCE